MGRSTCAGPEQSVEQGQGERRRIGQVHAAGFVRTVLRTAGGMSVTARKWGVPHPAPGRGAQRGSAGRFTTERSQLADDTALNATDQN